MEDRIQKIVLKLVAASLFGGQQIKINDEDLADVLEECLNQSILLVANEALSNKNDRWLDAVNNGVVNNIKVSHGHEEIHHILTNNHIPYCIIKGLASANYYPKSYTRTLGDIDFFIEKTNIEKVDKLLEQNDFIRTSNLKGNRHHINYEKDGCHFELHFNLNGIPEGKVEKVIKSQLIDFTKNARLINGLMLPSEYDHGLVIILHNTLHMFSEGIGLRHLVDWAVFVNTLGERFPIVFKKKFEAIGMWEWANTLTATCSYMLGLPKQKWCKEYNQELYEKIYSEIFQSGNFGKKKKDTRTGWFKQSTNSKITKGGILSKYYSRVCSIAKYRYPIVDKIKVLYPLGCALIIFRYLFMILVGKRKPINIVTTYKEATRSNMLIKDIHLFEVENNE